MSSPPGVPAEADHHDGLDTTPTWQRLSKACIRVQFKVNHLIARDALAFGCRAQTLCRQHCIVVTWSKPGAHI